MAKDKKCPACKGTKVDMSLGFPCACLCGTGRVSLCEPDDIVCPVCGYYCLGKGGQGCIDKPSLTWRVE